MSKIKMKTDKKILSYQQLSKKIKNARSSKKVVAVTGSWDIMHAGHLVFLDFAKRQGDLLVVGVGSDSSIKKAKGDKRPIIPEKLRLRMMAALELVDYVVLLDEPLVDNIDSRKLFEMINPDIWVFSYESKNRDQRMTLAKKMGIKVRINPRIRPNKTDVKISTSYIVGKLGL